jgi:hypothetical protein
VHETCSVGPYVDVGASYQLQLLPEPDRAEVWVVNPKSTNIRVKKTATPLRKIYIQSINGALGRVLAHSFFSVLVVRSQ